MNVEECHFDSEREYQDSRRLGKDTREGKRLFELTVAMEERIEKGKS